MSDDGADGWSGSFNMGPLLHVTGKAVARAMNGFSLSLASNWNVVILAGAVRLAWGPLAHWESGGPAPEIYGPNRVSNADTRAKLDKLADLAAATAQALDEQALGQAAESVLWLFAAEGDDPQRRCTGPDYRRYLSVVKELDWLAGFLKQAADGTQRQSGPWRQSEMRKLRIEKGRALIPIYEAVFEKTATANNWPAGKEVMPTPFMDFYQRMMALAFQEQVTPDLAGVLQEACREHRKNPSVS